MKDYYSPEIQARFWAKVHRQHPDDCWLWLGAKTKNGYGVFHHPKNSGAHRYSFELAFGPIPLGMHICHKCDVRECVNPAHLFLGTHKDNMRDARNKGRMKIFPMWSDPASMAKAQLNKPRGSDVMNSKLTDDSVVEMRQLRVAGYTFRDIAARFYIDTSTASAICKGEQWKHVFNRPDCPALGVLLAVEGNKKPNARLTEDQVQQVKKLLAAGVMGKDIAARFGVHKATISDIRCGKIWRDIS